MQSQSTRSLPERFRFMDLPPPVRDDFYAILAMDRVATRIERREDHYLTMAQDQKTPKRKIAHVKHEPLQQHPLTLTCSQVQQESLAIFVETYLHALGSSYYFASNDTAATADGKTASHTLATVTRSVPDIPRLLRQRPTIPASPNPAEIRSTRWAVVPHTDKPHLFESIRFSVDDFLQNPILEVNKDGKIKASGSKWHVLMSYQPKCARGNLGEVLQTLNSVATFLSQAWYDQLRGNIFKAQIRGEKGFTMEDFVGMLWIWNTQVKNIRSLIRRHEKEHEEWNEAFGHLFSKPSKEKNDQSKVHISF